MEPKTSQLPHKPVEDETLLYNQEFLEFLSGLPKERVIEKFESYQYQGFWYNPPLLHGIFNMQKHFQPCENDIFLVTAPKSGTTWLKALIYALMNREAHPPQSPHHPLLNKTPHQLVPFLEFINPSEYGSVCNSPDRTTRILATHCPLVSLPKSITDDHSPSSCKIVYLCRDVKDNFVSLFHFAQKNQWHISLEESFELYCKGFSGAGPVWDQISGYWKESLDRPHKVLFMRYEEMQNEPQFQLKRLAHFLGKPISEEDEKSGVVDQIINLCSFDTQSRLKVNNTGDLVCGLSNSSFFRKGVVGDWKNCLTIDMASKLDQITEEKFHAFGLSI
ncbi:hypothetical protein DCAR_0935289 [Daucus carota subsp. sativus]|uniref:Sulfotransferase n=1 Tax=Daucus carota subsp. sativus TaxID=79200 RepID=A0A175YH18_DAUCS|nr:PREDICTED: cytosolic sulfotransferase 13-like [Daucus carota subsp. sativus]WOH15745.1 hypothetical protein DCAR_0935289 [Daucus carota subsp. sativus]